MQNTHKCLILAIGIPASGKTTIISKMYADALVISPDKFIGYTKQDPWTPQVAKRAWAKADSLLIAALKRGTDLIIFDATFVKPHVRAKYIGLANQHDFVPIALHCTVPLKIAQARNLERDQFRQVPRFIVQNMHNNLILPSHGEGFKKILTYDSEKDKLSCSAVEGFEDL